MNTMKDLKRLVAARLHNTLDGREIDMIEAVRPGLPHMLGITPIGDIHDPTTEEGTILDPSYSFWDGYEDDVVTKNAVRDNLQTAIQLLREEERFRMEYPYGEEADVVYVEIDKPQLSGLTTQCRNCGRDLSADPSLTLDTDSYYISVMLDCPECDFTGTFRAPMEQL